MKLIDVFIYYIIDLCFFLSPIQQQIYEKFGLYAQFSFNKFNILLLWNQSLFHAHLLTA